MRKRKSTPDYCNAEHCPDEKWPDGQVKPVAVRPCAGCQYIKAGEVERRRKDSTEVLVTSSFMVRNGIMRDSADIDKGFGCCMCAFTKPTMFSFKARGYGIHICMDCAKELSVNLDNAIKMVEKEQPTLAERWKNIDAALAEVKVANERNKEQGLARKLRLVKFNGTERLANGKTVTLMTIIDLSDGRPRPRTYAYDVEVFANLIRSNAIYLTNISTFVKGYERYLRSHGGQVFESKRY